MSTHHLKFVLIPIVVIFIFALCIETRYFVTPIAQHCGTESQLFDLKGEIFIELADTPATQEKGLSGHKPLLPDEGMLFRFESPGTKTFWMKEILFSLDIIWLDPEWRVLSYVENETPESYPALFRSPSNTQHVLEVNAGFVAERKVVAGDIGKLSPCTEN